MPAKNTFLIISQVSLGWSMSGSLTVGVQSAARQLHLMASNLANTVHPSPQDVAMMATMLCKLCKTIEKRDCTQKPPVSEITACALFPLVADGLHKMDDVLEK
jgi:hypothetical protein